VLIQRVVLMRLQQVGLLPERLQTTVQQVTCRSLVVSWGSWTLGNSYAAAAAGHEPGALHSFALLSLLLLLLRCFQLSGHVQQQAAPLGACAGAAAAAHQHARCQHL
jgi:hypothetical protein